MSAFARQLALAQDVKGPPDVDDLDVRVTKLTLDVVRGADRLDAKIQNVISDGYVEQTMQGASELSVQVLDRDYSLIQSESLGYKVDSLLDDVPFRLVQVSLQEDFNVTLTFEHRIVAWLREHSGPLKASRGAMTRAEFVYRMIREVKAGSIRFVSPELRVKQPIKSAAEKPSRAHRDAVHAPGFADGTKLQLNGAPASPQQLGEVDRAMRVAASVQAPTRAVLAMVEAGILEGDGFRPIRNFGGSRYWGVFQGSMDTFAIDDTEGMAHSFLTGGNGFQGGGAIALSKQHPDWSPGQIAVTVEGSGVGPAPYDKFRKEADAVIAAWSGGGAGATFGAGGSYYARYEFTRGVNGQREDSWTCIQRLANEVRWRAFVAGKQSFFFCTDDDLMQSQPRYLIDPTTAGVQGLTFDVEVGGRTILIRGIRTPRPSQMTLMARADRWAAPPGTVIQVDDYGPANGRWLVDTVRRPLFDDLATITLRQPQKALAEPRSQLVQRTATAKGSGAIDAVYKAAQKISAKHLPYIYGGGHTNSWATAEKAAGLDCSSSVSLALHAGGLMDSFSAPIVSGDFDQWGVPGEGDTMTVWYSGIHVWIQFKGSGEWRFDTSPYGDGPSGPQLRKTPRPVTGFSPRHWPGT